jgi:STE24 endopeptidase
MNAWLWGALVVLGGRLLVELGLEALNRRYLRRQVLAGEETGSEAAARAQALAYAVARSRFREMELLFETGLLGLLWLTGLLARLWELWRQGVGPGLFADALFVWAVFAGVSVAGWPLQWYERFHLEQRFGFNTTVPATWWADRLKGLVLGLLLGLPLLLGLLGLMERSPNLWWFWGWAVVVVFQALMAWLAPVLILPWFHRFSPLPEGPLRTRLLALAQRTGFRLRDVQVMDGSRRTRHSNAFFTGWGGFRRVVLYDTLVAQLSPEELEAVVAHEIGHDRLRHWHKMMAGTALALLIGFALAGYAARTPSLFRAFGFMGSDPAIVLLFFGLWSGVLSGWLAPLVHACSRRWEFAADAFAARVLGTAESLCRALEKLHRENLVSLPSHPVYRWVHESHPSLSERLAALTGPTGAGSSCSAEGVA